MKQFLKEYWLAIFIIFGIPLILILLGYRSSVSLNPSWCSGIYCD